MDWKTLEQHFSIDRLGRYLNRNANDPIKAAACYQINLRLSEAMVPSLNVLEIALRNGIQKQSSVQAGREDWWESWRNEKLFTGQIKQIDAAKEKLSRRREQPTPSKIIAELTFGLWVSLFKSSLQYFFWQHLRLVFSYCPKTVRQRHHISAALSQVRYLCNRLFHHEPLLWLSPSLYQHYLLTKKIIGWIEPGLVHWLTPIDRFQILWSTR